MDIGEEGGRTGMGEHPRIPMATTVAAPQVPAW